MNVNEYGNKIRLNVSEDISNNINQLILYSPSPTYSKNIITSESGLNVPDQPVDVGGETYNANEYAEYTLKDGDITLAGEWRVRLISTTNDETKRIITDKFSYFTVDP